jgi:DNA-binding PadR family transcriptional regulator
MDIKYPILGFLSRQPLSGYDLKKRFASSAVLYWSGNSNQIYRALIELHRVGLVSYQVQQRESVPAKKVYALTAAGREALKAWILSPPEPLELRNPFLVQLAWAGQLSVEELDGLLERYEQEIRAQLQLQAGTLRREKSVPVETLWQAFLWEKIQENYISAYANQLRWVEELREELPKIPV